MIPQRWWRRPGGLVALALAASTLLRLAVAASVGFLTGDDVEVLEAAFAAATGLHYQPWEIRNLLFPRLLVAPVLSLAAALGVHDPFALVRLAALPSVALSSLDGWLVYRLAARLVDRWTAALAAAIFSFHWLPLAYGGTVYPRTASTTCVLLAALLVVGRRGEDGAGGAVAAGRAGLGRALGAGALVALGFADRYSEAIFLAPLLVFVLVSGRRENAGNEGAAPRRAGGMPGLSGLAGALGLVVGFALGTLATVGLADWAFWGRPFASLLAFARFTLLERRSSSLVTHQPFGWYLARIYVWLPPTLLPFLFAPRRRDRRGTGLLLPWLGVGLPLMVLSLVHHKELRYLQGSVPFLAILVAAGAAALWRAGWRRTTSRPPRRRAAAVAQHGALGALPALGGGGRGGAAARRRSRGAHGRPLPGVGLRPSAVLRRPRRGDRSGDAAGGAGAALGARRRDRRPRTVPGGPGARPGAGPARRGGRPRTGGRLPGVEQQAGAALPPRPARASAA